METLSPDEIDFEAYLRETDSQAKVKPASLWVEDVLTRKNSPSGPVGATLPWGKTHADFRFRPGEMSIWAGVNGHGKSLMLGQVVQGFAQQGQRSLIASFEMKPIDTVERMVRQAARCENYTDAFARRWGKWSNGLLWLYNQRGQTDPRRIYAVCKYAHQELDMQHIVIDSMMKVVKAEDDYNGQKAFIDRLFAIAQDTGLHIHLVHHMRKGEDEHKPGGKFNLKGSGAITDQVDNVFIVWKNKKKLFDRQAGKVVEDGQPDALLICEKQRNATTPNGERRVALWFDQRSTQFIGSQSAAPYQVVPDEVKVG